MPYPFNSWSIFRRSLKVAPDSATSPDTQAYLRILGYPAPDVATPGQTQGQIIRIRNNKLVRALGRELLGNFSDLEDAIKDQETRLAASNIYEIPVADNKVLVTAGAALMALADRANNTHNAPTATNAQKAEFAINVVREARMVLGKGNLSELKPENLLNILYRGSPAAQPNPYPNLRALVAAPAPGAGIATGAELLALAIGLHPPEVVTENDFIDKVSNYLRSEFHDTPGTINDILNTIRDADPTYYGRGREQLREDLQKLATPSPLLYAFFRAAAAGAPAVTGEEALRTALGLPAGALRRTNLIEYVANFINNSADPAAATDAIAAAAAPYIPAAADITALRAELQNIITPREWSLYQMLRPDERREKLETLLGITPPGTLTRDNLIEKISTFLATQAHAAASLEKLALGIDPQTNNPIEVAPGAPAVPELSRADIKRINNEMMVLREVRLNAITLLQAADDLVLPTIQNKLFKADGVIPTSEYGAVRNQVYGQFRGRYNVSIRNTEAATETAQHYQPDDADNALLAQAGEEFANWGRSLGFDFPTLLPPDPAKYIDFAKTIIQRTGGDITLARFVPAFCWQLIIKSPEQLRVMNGLQASIISDNAYIRRLAVLVGENAETTAANCETQEKLFNFLWRKTAPLPPGTDPVIIAARDNLITFLHDRHPDSWNLFQNLHQPHLAWEPIYRDPDPTRRNLINNLLAAITNPATGAATIASLGTLVDRAEIARCDNSKKLFEYLREKTVALPPGALPATLAARATLLTALNAAVPGSGDFFQNLHEPHLAWELIAADPARLAQINNLLAAITSPATGAATIASLGPLVDPAEIARRNNPQILFEYLRAITVPLPPTAPPATLAARATLLTALNTAVPGSGDFFQNLHEPQRAWELIAADPARLAQINNLLAAITNPATGTATIASLGPLVDPTEIARCDNPKKLFEYLREKTVALPPGAPIAALNNRIALLAALNVAAAGSGDLFQNLHTWAPALYPPDPTRFAEFQAVSKLGNFYQSISKTPTKTYEELAADAGYKAHKKNVADAAKRDAEQNVLQNALERARSLEAVYIRDLDNILGEYAAPDAIRNLDREIGRLSAIPDPTDDEKRQLREHEKSRTEKIRIHDLRLERNRLRALRVRTPEEEKNLLRLENELNSILKKTQFPPAPGRTREREVEFLERLQGSHIPALISRINGVPVPRPSRSWAPFLHVFAGRAHTSPTGDKLSVSRDQAISGTPIMAYRQITRRVTRTRGPNGEEILTEHEQPTNVIVNPFGLRLSSEAKTEEEDVLDAAGNVIGKRQKIIVPSDMDVAAFLCMQQLLKTIPEYDAEKNLFILTEHELADAEFFQAAFKEPHELNLFKPIAVILILALALTYKVVGMAAYTGLQLAFRAATNLLIGFAWLITFGKAFNFKDYAVSVLPKHLLDIGFDNYLKDLGSEFLWAYQTLTSIDGYSLSNEGKYLNLLEQVAANHWVKTKAAALGAYTPDPKIAEFDQKMKNDPVGRKAYDGLPKRLEEDFQFRVKEKLKTIPDLPTDKNSEAYKSILQLQEAEVLYEMATQRGLPLDRKEVEDHIALLRVKKEETAAAAAAGPAAVVPAAVVPPGGPPAAGLAAVVPPGGPPAGGPPAVGPPAVGPPAVGPPAVGPPAVGPPAGPPSASTSAGSTPAGTPDTSRSNTPEPEDEEAHLIPGRGMRLGGGGGGSRN